MLRTRLADLTLEDVLGRRRFLTASVPSGLGPDAGVLGPEDDAAGVGDAGRDEVGDVDSVEETTTLPFLAASSASVSSESESSIASAGVERGRLEGALGGTVSLCLGAVTDFLVAVVAFGGAVLDRLALALTGSFVAASLLREPGQGTKSPGDDTGSSISRSFPLIVASFSFRSLDDPDEAGLSCKDLQIEIGGAADAVLTGEFPGPICDDIGRLSGVC